MNKKHLACVVVAVVILVLLQATSWMNKRMHSMQVNADRAAQNAINSANLLSMEKSKLATRRAESKGLIDFLNIWKVHFAAVDSSETAELNISLKIREDNLISLSQRYDVVTQSNASLPAIMRAQVTFEDKYAVLLNWIGRLEADLPTLRINNIRLTHGTNPKDIKVEMVMEQPILKLK